MIDSVVNLLFRCRHKRLTRPVTPVSKDSKLSGDTYVVCLDCGKQFSYDLREMRIGKPLPNTALRSSRLKLAVMASVLPIGIGIASMLKSKRQRTRQLPPPGKTADPLPKTATSQQP